MIKNVPFDKMVLTKMNVLAMLVCWASSLILSATGSIEIQAYNATTRFGDSVFLTCTSTKTSGVQFLINEHDIGQCNGEVYSCGVHPGMDNYRMESDISIHRYFLIITAMSGSTCGTYSCQDIGDAPAKDEVLVTYTDLDNIRITDSSEPAVGENGTISVSTSCILPAKVEDIVVTWYKVLNDGTEVEVTNTSLESQFIESDPTGCDDVCNGETSAHIITGFRYDVNTTTDVTNYHWKITIVHVARPDAFVNWTSSNGYNKDEHYDHPAATKTTDKPTKASASGLASLPPIAVISLSILLSWAAMNF